MHAKLLDLEFDVPHFCHLFRKYAEVNSSALGPGAESNGSSMFSGLHMTEDGWLRFQSEEQLEHDVTAARKVFRAVATSSEQLRLRETSRVHFKSLSARRPSASTPSSPVAKPAEGSVGSDVVAVRSASPQRRHWGRIAVRSSSFAPTVPRTRQSVLTFVEFVKLLLCPANRALDSAALRPEDDHADSPLAHFWIATSHNSYVVGHQLTGYADEAVYRRQLEQGCRSLEIDCWNGARGEPAVTHGNTLVNKISFASVAKAVSETAFVTSQAPVILSLEMHCGKEQQARIAELLLQHLGAQLLTPAELERLSEEELTIKALQRRVLIKAKVPQLTPDDLDDKKQERVALESRESALPTFSRLTGNSVSQRGRKGKTGGGGSKGVIEPSLRALICMPSLPAPRFLTGQLPPSEHRLPVSSLSEPLLQSIFAAAGEDLRAEAAARVQRITRGWQVSC